MPVLDVPQSPDTPKRAPLRAGWKTTEFWITLVSILSVTILLYSGAISVDEASVLWPLFLAAGGYSIGRGLAKF